jgi:hypothetical protein
VHFPIRITGRGVFDDRDLTAEFSGEAHGRLDARASNETDDDELMDTTS